MDRLLLVSGRSDKHFKNSFVKVRQKIFRSDNKLSGYESLTGIVETDVDGVHYANKLYRIRFDLPHESKKLPVIWVREQRKNFKFIRSSM